MTSQGITCHKRKRKKKKASFNTVASMVNSVSIVLVSSTLITSNLQTPQTLMNFFTLTYFFPQTGKSFSWHETQEYLKTKESKCGQIQWPGFRIGCHQYVATENMKRLHCLGKEIRRSRPQTKDSIAF